MDFKKFIEFLNYINNLLKLPNIYKYICDNINYYIYNINPNNIEKIENIVKIENNFLNINNEESIFLEKPKLPICKEKIYSCLLLSKFCKRKIVNKEYQKKLIATFILQKHFKNNIKDSKKNTILSKSEIIQNKNEISYYNYISKSLSFLNW
jgi:hypothetical protein